MRMRRMGGSYAIEGPESRSYAMEEGPGSRVGSPRGEWSASGEKVGGRRGVDKGLWRQEP